MRTKPDRTVRWLGLPFLAGALLVCFGLSLSLGSVHIPLAEVFAALLNPSTADSTHASIILLLRLPKALTAVLVGMALSISGLQMQTLFRNPLADPFVLGINAGASLGVALVVLFSGSVGATLLSGMHLLGDFALVGAAGLGAALVLFAVLVVSRKVQSVMTLLILGLMLGYATAALVSVLLYFSIPEQIQAYIIWTFGSFGGVSYRQLYALFSAVLLGVGLAIPLVKPLNALLLGEHYAASMGVHVRRIRIGLLISASLLTGSATAFCGPIAFLGLAVPHLCRSLFATSDHRFLLPAVALMGASLALIADIVAQMPGSQAVLPLNAVTSLLGAPVVIWVILRRQNLNASFAG